MKKFFALLVIFTIILSTFTACESFDYKKAVKLMDNGNYEEAKTLFAEISDYKDSSNLIRNCNWEMILDYYSENYENKAGDSGSVVLFHMVTTSDRSGIDMSYLIIVDTSDSSSDSMAYCYCVIEKNNLQSVKINATFATKGVGIEATTTIDFSKYKRNDSLNWDINLDIDSTIDSRAIDSRVINDTFNSVVNDLYSRLETALNDSGLGITLEDL